MSEQLAQPGHASAGIELRVVSFDHPEAVLLTDEVQQEYVIRYGGPDKTPIDPAEFAPPEGLFLVAYLDGEPVGCGGWRPHQDGRVELKRMYVRRATRGRGLSRLILAELERTAWTAGHRTVVLETGTRQPEAIGLYQSSGYTPTEPFGVYAAEADSHYYAKNLEVPNADLRTG